MDAPRRPGKAKVPFAKRRKIVRRRRAAVHVARVTLEGIPRLLGGALALQMVAVALLVGLAVWQWQRIERKAAVLVTEPTDDDWYYLHRAIARLDPTMCGLIAEPAVADPENAPGRTMRTDCYRRVAAAQRQAAAVGRFRSPPSAKAAPPSREAVRPPPSRAFQPLEPIDARREPLAAAGAGLEPKGPIMPASEEPLNWGEHWQWEHSELEPQPSETQRARQPEWPR